MKLFDTTLRDGGNVVGDGFNAELTVSIVRGLLSAGIKDIELGSCKGLGAYERMGATRALSDTEYYSVLSPWVDKGRLGMFVLAGMAREDEIKAAADAGMYFLRVGANAGDGAGSLEAIRMVKKAGLYCRYALMKGYILSPAGLAGEARMLADAGADCVTIMDSAGTMFPDEAAEYVRALKSAVSIPVGFHGHSNLGLSQANALAAAEAGADEIDCGLLGMARSAGNMPTELAVALMHQQGRALDVDLYTLLQFEDQELIPAMEKEGYHTPLKPKDLILGYSGAHSSFMKTFKSVAQDCGVDLYHLIVETSKLDRKAPTEALMRQVAAQIKGAAK